MIQLTPGDHVTLTLRNRSAILLGPLAHHFKPTRELTGQVMRKPSWLKEPNAWAILVEDTEVPVRVVYEENVLAVNGVELKSAEPSQVKTWEVTGSKGESYVVTQQEGQWRCTCAGFSFRKTCRHVHQVQSNHQPKR